MLACRWRRRTGIALGPDLGALQYDASNERVYLPFGAKKFAILDATHNKHWNDIRLDGRPGAFALEEGGTRAFVAAVGEKRIMIADREGNKQTGSWPTGDYGDAASLALDEDAGRLIVAFRQPAAIAWFDLADGSMKGHADACAKPGQVLADSSRSAALSDLRRRDDRDFQARCIRQLCQERLDEYRAGRHCSPAGTAQRAGLSRRARRPTDSRRKSASTILPAKHLGRPHRRSAR